MRLNSRASIVLYLTWGLTVRQSNVVHLSPESCISVQPLLGDHSCGYPCAISDIFRISSCIWNKNIYVGYTHPGSICRMDIPDGHPYPIFFPFFLPPAFATPLPPPASPAPASPPPLSTPPLVAEAPFLPRCEFCVLEAVGVIVAPPLHGRKSENHGCDVCTGDAGTSLCCTC